MICGAGRPFLVFIGDRMKRIFAAICLWSCALCASAQSTSVYTWQDFGKRLKSSQAISPLGPNFAGEQVSLSNGELSFSATDVSLPGNNDLEVAFTRSYSVKSRGIYAAEVLGDWSISVPHIWGMFTTDWTVGGTTPDNRCSNTNLPPAPGGGYIYSDYWLGLTIQLPGGGGGDLLVARTDISPPKPATGGPYPWVTENGTVYLACLGSIKNGTGQGFIATLPNGTRVWYDWMAQSYETSLKGNQLAIGVGATPIYSWQERRRNYLLATRVEDRFGNSVDYTYANSWNASSRLTKILASDGRQITINYAGAFVSSVTDGTRTWTYGYSDTSRGRKSLSSVTLPDASSWFIGFSAFTDAEIKLNEAAFDEPLRSCTRVEIPLNYAEQLVGSITHPAGGVGTFTVNIQEHGRSSVPVSCGHVTTYPVGSEPGLGNHTQDDINTWAISANSYTLIKKRISGPGLATAEWDYSYSPGISVYRYPGTTRDWKYPVCDWNNYNCALPPCQSETCAGASVTTITGPGGEWSRYRYGNTYLYNEGKLLRVEKGESATSILSVVKNTYDLSMADQAYPAKYGNSLRVGGDQFIGEYHRPLIETSTDQQGIRFKYHVNIFDGFARPVKVTRSSDTAPVDPPPPTPSPEEPPPTPLAAPTISAPNSALQGTSYTISWTSVAGATYYVLERKTSTSPWAMAYNGAATSKAVTNVSATTASARVMACNDEVCSPYSAVKNITITSGGGGIEP